MKSKTTIDKQMKRKTNPEIVESILKAKKNTGWLGVASILSSPRTNKVQVNLDRIDEESKEGDTIIVPGKVLGKGDVSKKIRVAALSFSSEAEKKLKEKKCEVVSIIDEIRVNPKAQGIKILK
jgi:large subunit ribosomal protein L18e